MARKKRKTVLGLHFPAWGRTVTIGPPTDVPEEDDGAFRPADDDRAFVEQLEERLAGLDEKMDECCADMVVATELCLQLFQRQRELAGAKQIYLKQIHQAKQRLAEKAKIAVHHQPALAD
jgi:hypothetical protein